MQLNREMTLYSFITYFNVLAKNALIDLYPQKGVWAMPWLDPNYRGERFD